MSGLFGSVTLEGNRLTEFAAQTATVGVPITFGFGLFPAEGNVIFAPMPPKEHVKKKKQGKGGVKSQTYSYTLSYAIAFCEGPIFGYWTIKRGGKVVYTQDPAATIEDKAYAAKWLEKATFYFGTRSQLPDSTIESYKGAGLVSAFRDLAYIVVEDDDVTDNGGAVPTYEAICMGTADTYFTTPIYSLLTSEGMDTSGDFSSMADFATLVDELDLSATFTGGELRTPLVEYENNPPDELDVTATFSGGEFRDILRIYDDNPPDELDTSANFTGGELKTILIVYSNNPPDELDTSATLTGGTLA